MKRTTQLTNRTAQKTARQLVLAASLVMLGLGAIAPTAAVASSHRQVSTAEEVSEDATFHDLIRNNRDARRKG